jgi:hypothetical protein
MWTYTLGPILAFLPKWWRRSLRISSFVQWRQATIASGLVEFLGALVCSWYWYLHEMTTWLDRGMDSALAGKLGANVTDQQVGAMAFSLWISHPITWLLGYCVVEGPFRFLAATFTGEPAGSLPLVLLDKLFFSPFRKPSNENLISTGKAAANVASIVGAIQDRAQLAKPELEDELHFAKDGADEILEINASRRKPDWDPPRVVRCEDAYYRLESSSRRTGPRPFRYILRRLPAGVPGRTVLIYSPPGALVRD